MGREKKREKNYLPYNDWICVRCIALMHRHLRHSTCNVKAISICWGCTWLITPYSLEGLRGWWVVQQLGPRQNPAGRTSVVRREEAPCLHRHRMPLGTTGIDIRFLWQMTGHQQPLFADSQTVTWYAESRCSKSI